MPSLCPSPPVGPCLSLCSLGLAPATTSPDALVRPRCCGDSSPASSSAKTRMEFSYRISLGNYGENKTKWKMKTPNQRHSQSPGSPALDNQGCPSLLGKLTSPTNISWAPAPGQVLPEGEEHRYRRGSQVPALSGCPLRGSPWAQTQPCWGESRSLVRSCIFSCIILSHDPVEACFPRAHLPTCPSQRISTTSSSVAPQLQRPSQPYCRHHVQPRHGHSPLPPASTCPGECLSR